MIPNLILLVGLVAGSRDGATRDVLDVEATTTGNGVCVCMEVQAKLAAVGLNDVATQVVNTITLLDNHYKANAGFTSADFTTIASKMQGLLNADGSLSSTKGVLTALAGNKALMAAAEKLHVVFDAFNETGESIKEVAAIAGLKEQALSAWSIMGSKNFNMLKNMWALDRDEECTVRAACQEKCEGTTHYFVGHPATAKHYNPQAIVGMTQSFSASMMNLVRKKGKEISFKHNKAVVGLCMEIPAAGNHDFTDACACLVSDAEATTVEADFKGVQGGACTGPIGKGGHHPYESGDCARHCMINRAGGKVLQWQGCIPLNTWSAYRDPKKKK